MKTSFFKRGAVAVAAAGLLAAGGLVAPSPAPAPANAGLIEEILDTVTPPHCVAGDDDVDSWPGATADCTGADPSILAKVGDAVLGLFVPDLPSGIFTQMNQATAVGLQISLNNPVSEWFPWLNLPSDISLVDLPASATISGTGYTSALGILGNADASADLYLSGALAIAGPFANETAKATFGGIALAAGASGLPQDLQDAIALVLGDPTEYQGTANALPGGVAIVLNIGYNGAATALGGYASAIGSSSPLPGLENKDTVCTALYGTASLTDKDGKNVSSCTSILWLLQQSQQGEGPVIYAIKNPFSLRLTSPLTGLQNIVGLIGNTGLLPPEIVGLFDIGFQPEFTSDLIRVVMTDSGPKFETDIFKDLGLDGPLGSSNASGPAIFSAKSAPAPADTVDLTVADEQPMSAAGTDEVTLVEDDADDATSADESTSEEPVDAPAGDDQADEAGGEPSDVEQSSDDAASAVEEAPVVEAEEADAAA